MKRLCFFLFMLLSVNIVNAQYCRTCDINDNVLNWKTWKHVKYNCEGYNLKTKEKLKDCVVSLRLSLCQHNLFSIITLKIKQRTSDPAWAGFMPLVEQISSFYEHEGNEINVRLLNVANKYLKINVEDYNFLIVLKDYPNAYNDTMMILQKAKDINIL